VLFGLVAYLAFSQFVRRGVTPAPDVLGMSEADASALLSDHGLRADLSDGDERYDEHVPAGHVLFQRPTAGTLVKRGSQVTLHLSRGPQQLQVPDVVGSAAQAAQVTLAAAGLTLGRTLTLYSEEGVTGEVIGQQPAAGTRAEHAAQVDLFLAGGSSRTWVMPDLVYLNYENVRRFFEARGFRIGRVSYEVYPRAPGTVLRQFPQAGHPLHEGDVIALTLVAVEAGAQEDRGPSPPVEEEGPRTP